MNISHVNVGDTVRVTHVYTDGSITTVEFTVLQRNEDSLSSQYHHLSVASKEDVPDGVVKRFIEVVESLIDDNTRLTTNEVIFGGRHYYKITEDAWTSGSNIYSWDALMEKKRVEFEEASTAADAVDQENRQTIIGL